MDDPPAEGLQSLSWSLDDCDAAVAVVPVPSARLQAHLPGGFRLLTPAEVGLPPDPRGDAVLGLEAFACGSARTENETASDVPHGGIFSFVEPPADLADPDVDFFHFFRWDTLLGEPTLRAFYADAGAPVFDGTATVTATPGPAGPLGARLEVNGTTFTFDGGSPAPSGSTGGTFVEFMHTPEGLASWKVTGVAPFGQGVGRVQVTGGLAEDVLGAAPVPGYVLYLTGMGLANGTATVP